MERDYDFASAVYAGDLRSPEEIGRSAAERAIKRLNPRKMPTGKVPRKKGSRKRKGGGRKKRSS